MLDFLYSTIVGNNHSFPLPDEEEQSILPISTSEQYISLLIVESKTWKLCDTILAVMADLNSK